MLKVKANKLKTNGILITELTYIRISFTTRYGEVDPNNEDNVLAWIQYRAWTKSSFDESGLSAPMFTIDGINDEIVKSINKTESYGWVEFNQLFKQYMIDTLGLVESDFEIVGL